MVYAIFLYDTAQNSNKRIIDIALKYGYESPISFTRAFQAMHGMTPTMARYVGVKLKAYPRMTFHLSIKGGSVMEYKIEKKDAFEVFGIEKVVSINDGEGPGEFWQKCHRNGAYERLAEDTGDERFKGLKMKERRGKCAIFAVMNYCKTGKDTFPYMIGAKVTEKSKIAGYTTAKIPAMTWTIFGADVGDNIGSMMGELINRAYSEWFPHLIMKGQMVLNLKYTGIRIRAISTMKFGFRL